MATQHGIDTRTGRDNGPLTRTHDEPHLRDLFKQLASDGSELVRGEVALAKLEMRDMARELAVDSTRVAVAIGIALTGALALLAAAVIGLGHLLDGRFGLSALIVGVVMLVIGGVLARGGIAGLKDTPKRPEATVQSLQRDKQWASRELRDFKDEIRS